MPKYKHDPHLLYLMGRCYEQGGGVDATFVEKAVRNYQEVLAITGRLIGSKLGNGSRPSCAIGSSNLTKRTMPSTT